VQPEIHVVTADGSSVHKVFLPAGTPPTLAITSGTAETRPTNACFVGGETASGGSQQAIAPAMKALLAATPVRHAKADYDGDGLTDIAIFQPSIATWFVWLSKSQSLMALQFGSPGDIPVAGDYDGDGITDIAVFSPLDRLLVRVAEQEPITAGFSVWQSGRHTGDRRLRWGWDNGHRGVQPIHGYV
jgi:FG-GAP-like repeat